MTIDEAIEQEKIFSKEDWSNRKRYHEQLAEWLEELKDCRNKCNDCTLYQRNIDFENGSLQAYKKAIDDFVTKISESNQGHWRPTQYEHGEVVSETMSYDIGTIKEIAEQLKAGNSNGS